MKVDCVNDECKKPTWKGCGLHITQALADVPYEERCPCKARTNEEQVEVKKAEAEKQ